MPPGSRNILSCHRDYDWSEKPADEPGDGLAARRFQAWTDYSIEKSLLSGSENRNTASFHGKIKPVVQQADF
jgi:hypothetical protein